RGGKIVGRGGDVSEPPLDACALEVLFGHRQRHRPVPRIFHLDVLKPLRGTIQIVTYQRPNGRSDQSMSAAWRLDAVEEPEAFFPLRPRATRFIQKVVCLRDEAAPDERSVAGFAEAFKSLERLLIVGQRLFELRTARMDEAGEPGGSRGDLVVRAR